MKYGVWIREPWPGDRPTRQFWMTSGKDHTRMEYDTPEQAAKGLAEAFPKGVPSNLGVQPIERVYAVQERETLPVTGDVHEFWHTDRTGRIEYDTAEEAKGELQRKYPDGVPSNVSVEPVTPTSAEDRQRMKTLDQAKTERWTQKDRAPAPPVRKPPVKSFEEFTGQNKPRER